MGADDFRDYILGCIFYKYLSERMHLFADEILKNDGITKCYNFSTRGPILQEL